MTTIEMLRDCFLQLTDTQMHRLVAHYRKDTVILCGKQAALFTDGKGGA